MHENMEDLPYSNREIKSMIKGLHDKLDGHTKVHDDILMQVKYTNGRVRWNEKMIYMAVGALGIVVPVLAWYMTDYLHFKETYKEDVAKSVEKVLNTYEFEPIP